MKFFLICVSFLIGCSNLSNQSSSFKRHLKEFKQSQEALRKNKDKLIDIEKNSLIDSEMNEKEQTNYLSSYQRNLDLLLSINSEKCFSLGQDTIAEENECKQDPVLCEDLGLSLKEKKLFLKIILPHFKVEEVSIDSNLEYISVIKKYSDIPEDDFSPNEYNKTIIDYCSLLSSSGVEVESKPIRSYQYDQFAEQFFKNIRRTSEVETFVELTNFMELNNKYEFVDSNMNKEFSEWEKYYSKWANLHCQNSRIISGELVFEYETKACHRREVTTKDLDQDLEYWKKSDYVTEATILMHKLFRDQLIACQKAHYLTEIRYKPVLINKKACKE